MDMLDKLKNIGNTILFGEDVKADSPTTHGVKYDDELEKFISMVISSGSITDKQREILCKKAESKGVDRDEFEMVLDYRLQYMTNISPTAEGKHRNVKKCPYCGAIVRSLSFKCDECGNEFSDSRQNGNVQELISQLSVAGRKGGLIGILTHNIETKKEIIRNYPIPTSKEGIFEFLIYAAPLAIKKGNIFTRINEQYEEHNELVPTWRDKCSQIWAKAKIVFADSPKELAQIKELLKPTGIK